MNYHLSLHSSNKKTGPIPVSTSPKQTCPVDCGMRDACYAKISPLNIHWIRISEGKQGDDWKTFLGKIQALPDNQIWRHNQAGDLPGDGKQIDVNKLIELVQANKGKRGFTYTHYSPKNLNNKLAIKLANEEGFVINLSADNISQVDKLLELNIGPVVTVLPLNQSDNLLTPAGNAVIVCPAVKDAYTTCQTCKLCAKANRKVVIGFPAHGVKKNKANEIASFV